MTGGQAGAMPRFPGPRALTFTLPYPAKERPTSGAQISLSVDNIEAAHAAAVCAGARVLHEPRNEPWGRSGRYADFDGNVIELTQHAN